MKALVDNDVLLKSGVYDLLEVLLTALPEIGEAVGVLGAARYVLSDALMRRRKTLAPDLILARLVTFIEANEILEPTREEQELAAEFESLAQMTGLALDTGESQLCAILIVRHVPLLITGDKRAIIALENLLNSHVSMAALIGRVRCFEQLIKLSLNAHSGPTIWTSICAHRDIDKALSICFSCASGNTDLDSVHMGLESYINALKAEAPQILSV
jgi:hypothetical protein